MINKKEKGKQIRGKNKIITESLEFDRAFNLEGKPGFNIDL